MHQRKAERVRFDPNEEVESLCQIGASELLMPEGAVRRAFKEGANLADRFGVSDEAMAWRLFNFGLVEKSPA